MKGLYVRATQTGYYTDEKSTVW